MEELLLAFTAGDLIVLGAAAAGGLVRGIWGYFNNAPVNENFSWTKFGKTMVQATGAGLVIGMALGPDSTWQKALLAAFSGVAIDVLAKDGYGTAKYLTQEPPKAPVSSFLLTTSVPKS